MLIPIKRYYLGTKEEYECMLNTLYIIKIEQTHDGTMPKVRIVLDDKDPTGGAVIYTNTSYSVIKGLVTKAKNRQQELELG